MLGFGARYVLGFGVGARYVYSGLVPGVYIRGWSCLGPRKYCELVGKPLF